MVTTTETRRPRFSSLEAAPRNQRRLLLAAEAKARRSGAWGEWETMDVGPGTCGPCGWPAEVTMVHRNKCFAVLRRHLPDGTVHLAVSSLSQIRPTWWEMQRIKNELTSLADTGVEVYPPADDVVDAADMFHLWVLPAPLPFSLASDPAALTMRQET